MSSKKKSDAAPATLIVQHILITWTKASRGGPLAERRSEIPVAFPVPHPPPVYDRNENYIVHKVDFGERNEFVSPIRSQTILRSIDTKFSTTNCTVEFTDAVADVVYEWRSGAPEQKFFDKSGTPVPVRKRLNVETGKWVRVEYNVRFSGYDCGNWFYEHSIINVALATPESLDIFVTSKPSAEFQQLSHLW
ncbi:MAG: hypothetical protein KDA65_02540 [Planctomycetaceae bacterium]|nr:hypothetical protein [Planctomycetaceae bacterium]